MSRTRDAVPRSSSAELLKGRKTGHFRSAINKLGNCRGAEGERLPFYVHLSILVRENSSDDISFSLPAFLPNDMLLSEGRRKRKSSKADYFPGIMTARLCMKYTNRVVLLAQRFFLPLSPFFFLFFLFYVDIATTIFMWGYLSIYLVYWLVSVCLFLMGQQALFLGIFIWLSFYPCYCVLFLPFVSPFSFSAMGTYC
jgi:hypothetical protein